MSEHLSAGDLRQYRERNATPAALLSWDDHLSQCAACRARLTPGHSLAAWASSLEAETEPHLTYEQLVARAESRVAGADRFAIESHLKQCSSCADELADLVSFVRPAARHKAPIWPWLAAAALLILVGGAILVLRGHPPRPAVAVLNIPTDWPAADRALVEEVLHSGKLPSTPPPPDLTSKAGKLLGPSTPTNPFAPLAPLGAIVESDRPQFRWQPLDHASSYRVEVYDSGFRPVLHSPALTEPSWTPPQPLPRGQLYRWQIVAEITTGTQKQTVTVPSPPAPAASFRILDSATEARVAQARSTGPMGHLLAAALLAQAGMAPESLKELEALPAATRALPQIQVLIH